MAAEDRKVTPAGVRDISLDVYRALIMIYILCVIHVGYWLSFIGEPLSSLILFEMPVIFFISGAALSASGRRHSFRDMLVRRFKRIALPYYLYITVCIVLAVVCAGFAPKFFEASLSLNTIHEFLTFRQIEGLKFPYLYHTWFVLPYLLIYIIFWFEQKLCDRFNKWIIAGGVFAVCLLLQLCDNGFVRTTSIYNFFFVTGYLFYKRLSRRNIAYLLSGAIACCITLYCLGDYGGGVCNHINSVAI